MTPEERDELRRDLDAAGCPTLASAVGDFLGGAYITEIQSLLRREVWVVSKATDGRTIGVCSSAELAVRAIKGFGPWMMRCGKFTIDAEVPDADG